MTRSECPVVAATGGHVDDFVLVGKEGNASVEWNVPGKCGPHGELIFFLIKKEPATMPAGETFTPFFTADIRTH